MEVIFHEVIFSSTNLEKQFVGNKANLEMGVSRKQSTANFSKNEMGVINVRFSENLACFVFLKQPFQDSSFCLITDELTQIW